MNKYDVIVIGAGSIGVPTAMALAESKMKVIVIDSNSSPGQGDNKKAIGGLRATHSDPNKIIISKRSLKIYSTWKQLNGDDIEWSKDGYLFPIYRNIEKNTLTNLFPIQKKFNLNINFINHDRVSDIVPGINKDNLIGGTFSPDDGTASPLLAINAFVKNAINNGTKFKFKETVKNLILEKNVVTGVKTDKNKYIAPIVIDASGSNSTKLCKTLGIKIKVLPELHEAAITEPVKQIFKCMIVDLRPGINSKNFYMYQNIHGQIIFCITPDPPIIGTNTDETSTFLPAASRRIINLIPMLHNVRVRRMWKGCYPMSPDGYPIVGWNKGIKGLIHATGMCGQGFMLGPGIGKFIARMITKTSTIIDNSIQKAFSPHRKFNKNKENLK